MDTSLERIIDHMLAVKEHWTSISVIKECLATDRLYEAAEAWEEIPDDDKKRLWLAPRKGGCWTTKERDALKSGEFGDVYRSIKNADL